MKRISDAKNCKRISFRSVKIPGIILMAATLLLITGSLDSNDAYATHLTPDTKWQLVSISSYPACTVLNAHLMLKFDQLTEDYLALYQFENSKYQPLCMTEIEYTSEYEAPHDLDLIILVYDRELGEKELHGQKMGGLLTHSGADKTKNHALVICGDCSNFYYSDSVWILTHELSHFVLYVLDYDISIIEDLVHLADEKYDQCRKSFSGDCASIITKLRVDVDAYSYSVMPVHEPAVGQQLGDATKDVQVPQVVVELSKIITQWWVAGKITEGEFSNVLGYLTQINPLYNQEGTVLFADDPIDKDRVTWQDKFSELNSSPSDRDTITDINKNDILSKMPKNWISENERIFSEQSTLGLPEWFKNTADWWTLDKITDKEFKKNVEYLAETGIIRPHALQVLGKVVNEQTLVGSSLQGLLDDVESLVDLQNLNEYDGTKLIKKLDGAKIQFDNDNTANGCKNLDQFIEHVSVYIDESKLVETNGQPLINTVDIIKLNFC